MPRDSGMLKKSKEYVARVTKKTNSPADDGNEFLARWTVWATSVGYSGKFERRLNDHNMWYTRGILCKEFAWAILNPAAIRALCTHGPILEIGSGKGYWAYLMKKAGCNVIAVDDFSEKNEASWFPKTHHRKGQAFLAEHDGCRRRALFLCWPRRKCVFQSIDAYRGDTVIVIVDGEGSMEEYSRRAEWEMTEAIELPTFNGLMDDAMKVYKRRQRS
jgi:hypothetical protein